jgi:cyclopropane-fatty-acyl-phospholipid synthase
LVRLAERSRLPDALIRMGIRHLNRTRLKQEAERFGSDREAVIVELVKAMENSPVALSTHRANEQHYEVPAGFFEKVLGKHLKYSSALWPAGTATLDQAEAEMLALTAERAALADGMDILELGCGWGSLTLWNATHYPNSRITAVSNSASQRDYIEKQCRERSLDNVEVITADMNQFYSDRRYDRIISVEMFEHMRNWATLLDRINSWLKGQGSVFIHIFCHRQYAYPFESDGDDNWMGRTFFTGGMMPSDDLMFHFQKDLAVEKHWQVSGVHYQKTAEAWLANMGKHRDEIVPILAATYGSTAADLWFQRWRIFFMACGELWGYAGGDEWMVSHYRLKKASDDQ